MRGGNPPLIIMKRRLYFIKTIFLVALNYPAVAL
jgi:hypothetical protein